MIEVLSKRSWNEMQPVKDADYCGQNVGGGNRGCRRKSTNLKRSEKHEQREPIMI